MNTSFCCLITATKPSSLLDAAIDSCKKDSWLYDIYIDSAFNGPHKSREALLNKTYSDSKIQYIRYLDYDDTLLPHQYEMERIFSQFPDTDIIYTNAIMKMPSGISHIINYTGDPATDILAIHPWSWVAKKEALERIKTIYGYVWNYDVTYREGGYLWLKFIEAGLNIKYVPISAYQYNKTFNSSCISQQPGFSIATKEFIQVLKGKRVIP